MSFPRGLVGKDSFPPKYKGVPAPFSPATTAGTRTVLGQEDGVQLTPRSWLETPRMETPRSIIEPTRGVDTQGDGYYGAGGCYPNGALAGHAGSCDGFDAVDMAQRQRIRDLEAMECQQFYMASLPLHNSGVFQKWYQEQHAEAAQLIGRPSGSAHMLLDLMEQVKCLKQAILPDEVVEQRQQSRLAAVHEQVMAMKLKGHSQLSPRNQKGPSASRITQLTQRVQSLQAELNLEGYDNSVSFMDLSAPPSTQEFDYVQRQIELLQSPLLTAEHEEQKLRMRVELPSNATVEEKQLRALVEETQEARLTCALLLKQIEETEALMGRSDSGGSDFAKPSTFTAVVQQSQPPW